MVSVIEGLHCTMKPRGLRNLDAHGNLYKHPHVKHKGVYGFQGDLNPVDPGFIVQGIYTIANQIVSLLSNKTASLAMKLPSNGYSSYSE